MNGDRPNGGAAAGALRMIGALAVVLLACVAIGVVFDLVPREMLGELATKIGLLVLIVVAAGGVLIALLRRD